jgi:hypothetical protein
MNMLWEILVPCQTNQGKPIRTRQHKEWDRRVRRITGGLTVLSPAKGQWVSPSGKLFCERMIQVRIAATYTQMEQVSDLTAAFYEQEAVMFYKLSNSVTIREYPEHATKHDPLGEPKEIDLTTSFS